MISKRDNLLNRPWQEKQFQNHKRKIQLALPVVDNKSPPFRGHVALKLKKSQKECDRIKNIEKDNFLLLQRLNHIMRTKWVDNYLPPQPKFLNRVPIFHAESSPVEIDDEVDSPDENFNDQVNVKHRKLICPACTPQKPVEPKIPEERMPWEPLKKPVGRIRSKSVPVRKSYPLPVVRRKLQSASASTYNTSTSKKDAESTSRAQETSTRDKRQSSSSVSLSSKLMNKRSMSKPNLLSMPGEFVISEPQKIILSRGSLQLAVNFPPDTAVMFKNGHIEKYLTRVPCHCQNTPVSV